MENGAFTYIHLVGLMWSMQDITHFLCMSLHGFQLVPKVEILTITKHGPDGESMNRRVSCLFRTLFGHPFVRK